MGISSHRSVTGHPSGDPTAKRRRPVCETALARELEVLRMVAERKRSEQIAADAQAAQAMAATTRSAPSLFLHVAEAPSVERLTAPRAALSAAETWR